MCVAIVKVRYKSTPDDNSVPCETKEALNDLLIHLNENEQVLSYTIFERVSKFERRSYLTKVNHEISSRRSYHNNTFHRYCG